MFNLTSLQSPHLYYIICKCIFYFYFLYIYGPQTPTSAVRERGSDVILPAAALLSDDKGIVSSKTGLTCRLT